MEFKKGQIIFFRWPSFYSKLITLYNLKKYGEKGFTHVGIITNVKKNEIQIHEAISKGFVRSDYPIKFIENKIKEGIIKVKESKIKLIYVEDYSNQYLGRPYAWYDIFGIFISTLLGFKFLKLTGTKKLICSEAVSRVLYDSSNKKLNLSKEYHKPYDYITPMDIFYSKQVKS